jgi:predicted Fe-Mo cluster-binding NifX family protein
MADLPKLSKPAHRALAGIGVTTVAQIKKKSEAELLTLHGFGPAAIRLLAEAGIKLRKK